MGINVYQMVTDRIIAELENGKIPWHKPWSTSGKIGTGAYSRTTGKPYSLINQMMLPLTGEYATFKQITDAKGKVKKGEKSSFVVFFKMLPITEHDKDGNEKKKTIPFLQYYNVFHVATQCEGIEPKTWNVEENPEFEPIEEAEKIVLEYRTRDALLVREVRSDSAFYSPMRDYVEIPERKQFKDRSEFYGTLFHELVHSTGHHTRLNRFEEGVRLASFGSADYSKEELVAEIGSASILNELGIETVNSFNNSVAYIQSWIQVLKKDCKFIISASGKAEKAVNYIKGIKPSAEVITE